MNPAADKEIGFDRHMAGFYGFHKIIKDLVRHGFMKRPFIPVTPEIKFQALELNAKFVRNVTDPDGRKVRLSGPGAKAGKFRAFEVNVVIPSRVGIFDDFEFFRWLCRHNLEL